MHTSVYKTQRGTHQRSNGAWPREFREDRTLQEDRKCGAKARGKGWAPRKQDRQQHVRRKPHSWLFPGEAAPRTPGSGRGGEREASGKPETLTEAALVESLFSPGYSGKEVRSRAVGTRKDLRITRHHRHRADLPLISVGLGQVEAHIPNLCALKRTAG